MLVKFIDWETRQKHDIELLQGDHITFVIGDVGVLQGVFQSSHSGKIYIQGAVLCQGAYPSSQVDYSYYRTPRNYVYGLTEIFDIRKTSGVQCCNLTHAG